MRTTAPNAKTDREQAFKLFREIVDENYADGRRSYGASVKPELVRRTAGGFSEAALGFGGFRAFMEAAADAGEITIHKAPVGPDYEATPTGKPPLGPRDARARDTSRVRSDLWAAFVHSDPGWVGAYDRMEDRAFRYPRDPFPLEPADLTDTRKRVSRETARYVPITPITNERQLQWMKDFVAMESDPASRGALEGALRSPRPNRAFLQELREHPEVRSRWQSWRRNEVYQQVREWIVANDVELEIAEAAGDAADDPTQSASATRGQGDRLAAVRQTLHKAIDLMPEAELLRISVPVEYLLDR